MQDSQSDRPAQDVRLSFDQDPESYDRGRPEYPSQAFDDLFSYLGEPGPTPSPSVVEVGPGTGQATKALLDRGATVTAIEIGAHLSERLRAKLGSDAHLRVINRTFETVNLPYRAFDMVLAATAWKWLDPTVRTEKAVALLRRRGVLATLSTIQTASAPNRDFFRQTFPIYKKYRRDERWTDAPPPEAAAPPEYEEFRANPLLTDVVVHRYRWDQTYTSESYELLLRSYSDIQMMETTAQEGLIRDLRAVIDSDFGGTIVRPLVIALTMTRPFISESVAEPLS